MIVKHWRQDWILKTQSFMTIADLTIGNTKHLLKKSKRTMDTKIYEVDDKPRYEGSATWVHVDGRTFWENSTNAPLPRREYTQRSDYNITKRINEIEIVKMVGFTIKITIKSFVMKKELTTFWHKKKDITLTQK